MATETVDAVRDGEPAPLVARSVAMRRLLETVRTVAPTDTPVLITGETGTGKELVARAVHALGGRRDGPFVAVNCAALSSGVLESELFGHERGAFTGASARRLGRFESAHRGTILLDEVGEMPLETQAKLLRVLDRGEFERVGSSIPVRVDVRIVAATNRDPMVAVRAGILRSDLYYRLAVFPLHLPPLRERREAIPALVQHFVDAQAKRLGKHFAAVEPRTMACLVEHDWPGNVRELRNVVERAAILATGPVFALDAETLERLASSAVAAGSDRLVDIERDHLLRVLEATGWTIDGEAGAARRLGLNPSTLRSRLKRLGIRRPYRDATPEPRRVVVSLAGR